MHRFYLPPESCRGDQLFLMGREAHHALHVVRIRRGDRVSVLDGAGHELICEVQASDRDKVRLSVVEKIAAPAPPSQITLLQALPKGKLFESIIQKATELGAARIVPLLSERVIARLNEKEAARKTVKWQLVALEAMKQCGAPWLPKVETPITPEKFLERKESFGLSLIGSLQSDARHPRFYFHNIQPPKTCCVWIGPEGDFTPDEIQAIKASGAHPITLGQLVLRTETAAVYCLSVLNYELRSD